MRIFKKTSLFEFALALVFIVFFIYQIFSFMAVDVVYVDNVSFNPVAYITFSGSLILMMSIVLYLFPILLAIKLIEYKFNFNVEIKYQIQSIKTKLQTHLHTYHKIYQRLQVIRC